MYTIFHPSIDPSYLETLIIHQSCQISNQSAHISHIFNLMLGAKSTPTFVLIDFNKVDKAHSASISTFAMFLCQLILSPLQQESHHLFLLV